MDKIYITSNNYEGYVAQISFVPENDISNPVYLGEYTIPYEWNTEYYYGIYELYFPYFDKNCTVDFRLCGCESDIDCADSDCGPNCIEGLGTYKSCGFIECFGFSLNESDPNCGCDNSPVLMDCSAIDNINIFSSQQACLSACGQCEGLYSGETEVGVTPNTIDIYFQMNQDNSNSPGGSTPPFDGPCMWFDSTGYQVIGCGCSPTLEDVELIYGQYLNDQFGNTTERLPEFEPDTPCTVPYGTVMFNIVASIPCP